MVLCDFLFMSTFYEHFASNAALLNLRQHSTALNFRYFIHQSGSFGLQMGLRFDLVSELLLLLSQLRSLQEPIEEAAGSLYGLQ